MSKGFAANSRQILLASAVLASFAALGTRLVFLHVFDREELLRVVAQTRGKMEEVTARRGDILDARGALLATSRSLIVLAVDPQVVIEQDRKKWAQLAELIGMPLPELTRIFTTKFRPVPAATPATVVAPSSPAARLAFNLPSLPAPNSAAETAATDGDDPAVEESANASGLRPIRFAKLSDSVTDAVFTQIKALEIKGVIGTRSYSRSYPHDSLAAHIIGYVDRQEKPVTGIERNLDFYLHGRNGWRESEKDGKRQELAQFRTRDVPAADGYSVQLSIDVTVQHLIEDELAALAEKYQPQKATIIVSDPRTGFILGLGNYPTFDLNRYNQVSKDDQGRMKNIAATDQYEPGSVFKIVAAAGALNEGLVRPDTTFNCMLESIEYQGAPNNLLLTRKFPDEDHHFDHPLTVSEIIAHSSNRGASQLAMKLGDERFYRYVRAFGFGEMTGFPGGPESSGDLKPPEKWDSLTITRMPMGHAIAATPLQMHQAMSVIASGGLLLRPKVIRQIRDAAGESVLRYVGRQGERVISEQTASTVAYMLMGVASKEGTAPEAAIPNYQVAGKTGTAQKLLPVTTARGTRLEYSRKNHVVSFVGFLPASNPQLAISVIIDDADARCPGGVAYGSKVAAPIFKHLALQLIQYLDIKPVADPATAPKGVPPMLAYQGNRP